ncbi:MAG: tRNA (adenosine(37)-N6)-dimethylallyltransferase MiaA [Moorellales bacterium]
MELWVILGPTAVGKSQVGVEVAGLLDGEIVVADSMQVYKGLDIGTAKLTEAEKVAGNGRYIPHHLVDIITPDQPFSVAEYQQLARQAIAEISGRGKVPLLVGGSPLYLRAVTDPGYSFPPLKPDPGLRQRLHQQAREQGPESLHRELARVDPPTAARLHPNDWRRVVRALEIYYLTGQPPSGWRPRQVEDLPYSVRFTGLNLPRPELYRRINRRTEEMLGRGWVEEVKGLLAAGYSPELPSLQGLGYRQVVAFLQGVCSWEEMVRLIQRDTRRFAKRQLTWFRQDPRIRWFDVSRYPNARALAAEIVAADSRTTSSDVEYTTPTGTKPPLEGKVGEQRSD